MNETQHTAATCRLIRMPEVLAICGMSRATLYREIKAKEFPAQVRLSARSVGWLEDEVMAWVAARLKLRATDAG
jgi:predicted DNA-binding transcriptional regulator AlpA